MTATTALVPVKALAASKSRLFPERPRADVEALSLAMMGDLIACLRAVDGLDTVWVTTPDATVAERAEALGARALLRPDPGLNAALEAGAREIAHGDEALLVVLGDVAAADPAEIARLLEAAPARGVALAPSSDGGTSALLRRPADAIPARFGPDSAKAHREAAHAAGVACVELELPSLAIDLDVGEDARAILALPTLGARTRRLLEDWGVGTPRLSLSGLTGVPSVKPGDDLAALLDTAASAQGVALRDGVLVVCQKVVSKAEGRVVALANVEPSPEARRIAEEDDKDARQVELVLRESTRIVRRAHGVLITETHHGFVCANAGVDLSNAGDADTAVLLPVDPDASARALRNALEARGAGPLAVVVSDTFGRPWREGLVDLALGCAGLAPIDDLRGGRDWEGRPLEVTATATADQLAAAAGLLMRKDAGIPAVWVDGVQPGGEGGVRDTLRDPATDLFR